jgi:omega-6 fatty acid desaturase (delta-12 desaturase)
MYPIIFIVLCRSVVLLHDAGHNALYKEKWKNSLAGNLMGLMNLIPNELFSYLHNMHHAAVGNLDKRHLNPELNTMTTEEYKSATFFQ